VKQILSNGHGYLANYRRLIVKLDYNRSLTEAELSLLKLEYQRIIKSAEQKEDLECSACPILSDLRFLFLTLILDRQLKIKTLESIMKTTSNLMLYTNNEHIHSELVKIQSNISFALGQRFPDMVRLSLEEHLQEIYNLDINIEEILE